MTVGSLHSFYFDAGCEIEEGIVKNQQQNGLQWPAIYKYQDCEAAKGLWIGTTNFTDAQGINYPIKVVHVGPRVVGSGEFFGLRLDLVSRFEPPKSYVDGQVTASDKPVLNDFVDPTLKCDRMLINEANTAIGISMTRKILGFSQQFHDNYLIYEYTFRNTGNANDDATIEFPNKTLTGVYFYFQYRYAVCREARYVINNQTGWGINSMVDTRGDGQTPASTFFPGNKDNDIRAQYTWQGRYPNFTLYDNIGASVWTPPQSVYEPFSDRSDTSGRLCAPQFVGIATIHADRSATDRTDDPNQPSTTSYEGSDDPLNFNNNQFADGKMSVEYSWMTKGHVSPRHADKVGPTGDPSLGTSGGYSVANGYGPYTLAPGDSIRIVMVEAVAGLSRERAISVGERFKNGNKFNPPLPGGISAEAKNDSVYTGRDSLFQTFRRAIANYNSGYAIPQPPLPPRDFTVAALADKVNLTWDMPVGGPNYTGFRIYRSTGEYWNLYTKIHPGDLPATARSYDETVLVRGVKNFYYIVAVGDPAENNGAGGTPAGVALTSSRYYAQTYDGAELKRPPSKVMSGIRIVPNPYSISSYMRSNDPYSLRFPGDKDKIAFFDIPGKCRISIYTELGELVKVIDHTDGTGDASWNSITSSNQVVVSGIYIVVFEDTETGEKSMQKLIVIR